MIHGIKPNNYHKTAIYFAAEIFFVYRSKCSNPIIQRNSILCYISTCLYVLQNATIVDGTGVATQTDQDIIINGEIIEAIGENLKVPEAATILGMTGKSIMSGADINLKKFILEGKMLGPKIDATSPFLDRDGLGILETYSLKSTKQAIEAVNFYADMGSTSFKVYNYITRADLKAITETAHSHGFKVTVHLYSITH